MTEDLPPAGPRRRIRDRVEGRMMALAVGIAALGFIPAAALGLALTWDGGWQLARELADGVPQAPHARIINFLVDWPAILGSRVIDRPDVIVALHGLGHVALPIAALVASWRLLAPDRLDLLPVPMIGIGLLALPGLAFLVSEAEIVAILAWPLTIALARDRARRHPGWILATTLLVGMAHPAGVVVLAGASVTALAARKTDGRPDRAVAATFLVTTVVLGLRYVLLSDAYERGAATLSVLVNQFEVTLGGPIGVSVGLGFLAIALVIVAPRRSGNASMYGRLALIAVVIADLILIPWAADTRAWGQALRYRGPVAFVMVPAILALIVALLRPSDTTSALGPSSAMAAAAGHAERPGSWPGVVAIATASGFALVFTIQALAWRAALGRTADRLAAAAPGCVAIETLGIRQFGALDHWGLTATLLVLDGPAPAHVTLPSRNCGEASDRADIVVRVRAGQADDVIAAGRAGWWNLAPLEASLRP